MQRSARNTPLIGPVLLLANLLILFSIDLISCSTTSPAPTEKHFLSRLDSLDELFTEEQLDELNESELVGSQFCNYEHQNLLEEAQQKLVARGLQSIAEEFKQIGEKQAAECKSFETEELRDSLEKLVEKKGELLRSLFDKKQTEDELKDDMIENSKEIERDLSEIDSNLAEQLLTSIEQASLLPTKLALKLIERLNSTRYSFALGSIDKLKRLTTISAKDCNVEDLAYLFVKAIRFSNENLAISMCVQNVAFDYYKKCVDLGEQALSAYLKQLPKFELLEKLVENLNKTGFERANERLLSEYLKFYYVVRAMDRIATTSCAGNSLGGFNKLQGKELRTSCELIESLLGQHAKLAVILFRRLKSKELWELSIAREACLYVPKSDLVDLELNSRKTLDWPENMTYLLELAIRLKIERELIFRDNQPLEVQRKRVLKALFDMLDLLRWTKDMAPREGGAYFLAKIERTCAQSKPLRVFFWLNRAGYPLDLRRHSVIGDIMISVKVCELLQGIGFNELKQGWYERVDQSCVSKIRNFVLCRS